MKRLAMTAAVGLIAFVSSAGAGSSGAAPAAPDRPAPATLPGAAAVSARQLLPFADLAAMDAEDRAARLRAVAAQEAADRASRTRGARDNDRVWRSLAMCESNANPTAHSANGLYHGAFQFSIATWRGLGYAGDPADHSYAVQLEAAKKLQARSGWDQWPSCARQLGLL